MAVLPSSAAVLAPPGLPAPAGSTWEEMGGRRWRLARFSAGWREVIRQLTALRSLEVGVSTWQFVTNSPYLAWRGRWATRRGEMRRLEVAVDGEVVTSVEVEDAEVDRLMLLFEGQDGDFHRVQIYYPATTSLELAEVLVEPGSSFSLPSPGRRWCSWGDSITQGTLCPSGRESYVQRVAQSLGWMAINRGFGGAGCPDPLTAIAIATVPWDILTIAIGVNDAALGLVQPAEFGRLYEICLEIICQRQPGKPVLCISPIVCTLEVTETGVPVAARTAQIRQVIGETVARADYPNVAYLDGLELLAEEAALVDQIHPGPAGQAQMADRLAPRLASLVGAS
jgi:lysophospholipase L1-like esterase